MSAGAGGHRGPCPPGTGRARQRRDRQHARAKPGTSLSPARHHALHRPQGLGARLSHGERPAGSDLPGLYPGVALPPGSAPVPCSHRRVSMPPGRGAKAPDDYVLTSVVNLPLL